ncbi:MAG: hypothetical protein NZ929_04370 [Aigarchaeota archaeon]|nr:hypothetical protein [Aigarchaeota archaeon]MCX8192721.1 hypothetical protein [Nitrososphaeria archaeon]MDW7985973.1 hypothetical protein [Nitrososphaerota archaeon]
MTRGYRWIGGIGYILLLIPFVNFIGSILVAIAWIMAGGDTKQGIFKATGVLMITVMALSLVLVATLFPFMGVMMGQDLWGVTPSLPPDMFSYLYGALGIFLIIFAVMAVLGIVEWILELVSHFRAASVYNVKWFRRAGWMRIITIITLVGALVFLLTQIFSLISMGPFSIDPSKIINLIWTFISILIIPAVFHLLSLIFSAISFFTIPETFVKEPPSPSELPPPL